MITQKMTIHEALSELKTLDSRVEKKISQFTACVANKHSNSKIQGVSIDEFKKSNVELYQSITDLIRRRAAIKSAVVASNAETVVSIGGIGYRVAEAIEMKNSGIDLLRYLDSRIQNNYTSAVATCNNNNSILSSSAENYIIQLFGGENKNNVSAKTIEDAKEAYLKENQWEIVETIDCKKEMEDIEQRLNSFIGEVDAALSISNALTTIEISY